MNMNDNMNANLQISMVNNSEHKIDLHYSLIKDVCSMDVKHNVLDPLTYEFVEKFTESNKCNMPPIIMLDSCYADEKIRNKEIGRASCRERV